MKPFDEDTRNEVSIEINPSRRSIGIAAISHHYHGRKPSNPALARYRLAVGDGWPEAPSPEAGTSHAEISTSETKPTQPKRRTPAAGAKAAAEATREARMQVFILGIGAAFILSKVARRLSWYATYAGELGGFPF